jgi:hypothetical protein
MAVNVDTVYKTVLLILNKENRGYMTPDEFNKTAAQVQLDIFNTYFEDLNQQLRIPDNDSEYADRIKNLKEKISIFEDITYCIYDSGNECFETPSTLDVYKIGTVIYNGDKEVQSVQANELLELNLSPLTKPTTYYPVYRLKNNRIYVYPNTITSNIEVTYLRKPADPIWNFTAVSPSYTYVYDQSNSVDFELHPIEQTNIITNILMYSGIIIKDPSVVQIASQQIQSEKINEKS